MIAATLKQWPRYMKAEYNELTDKELVKIARKGNAEAFSELVRRHQHRVYNLSLRYMRDANRAEDMAQEAFLKGFRLLKGFRGECSFSTWMYKVTGSVCLTEIRKRKKRGEVELKPAHESSYISTKAQDNDEAELVRRCVTRLPEKYAAIVTLYYLDAMPYDEIAKIMEIPIGTLKTWMFRARKELRVIVQEELGVQS
jgi:RNA polymerase sigma-70 factor (ECF subfamily)